MRLSHRRHDREYDPARPTLSNIAQNLKKRADTLLAFVASLGCENYYLFNWR